jgi:hypothetical protein
VFHVYVEGVTGTEPDAVRKLSEVMAARYGLPAAEIYARLTRGRFRVKAHVDRATADEYARDLESVGARVGIETARATGPSAYSVSPPYKPSPPLPGARHDKRSLPALPAPRPMTSSLPPQATSRPGLSSLPPGSALLDVQLGAIDCGVLSLGAIDARALDEARIERAWPGPPSALAHIGPAALVPRPLPPDTTPLDRFAPPDEAAEVAVELAPDELLRRAHRRRFTPPAAPELPALPALPPPLARRAAWSPSLGQPVIPSPRAGTASGATPGTMIGTVIDAPVDDALARSARRAALSGSAARPRPSPLLAWMPASIAASLTRPRTPRARFAAGVFVAIALGYLPAALVGSVQEASAFRAIDAQVIAVQAAVDSTQSYDTLDGFRADQLGAKRSARRRAVFTSILVWAAASAGLACAWRFGRRPRRSSSRDTE